MCLCVYLFLEEKYTQIIDVCVRMFICRRERD